MADANAIAQALAQVLQPALANLAPAAPTAAVFSRTPADSRTALLDYTKTGDSKIFTQAIEALPTVFTLRTPNVAVLMSELETRTRASSWSTLMAMTINAVNINFLHQYGQVSTTELRTHVNTFIDANQRNAQNDYQLYLCLTNSVDGETKEVMQAERDSYLAGAGNNIESGLLYAKKLLITAEVDTRATTSHARDNLGALDMYMQTLADSDISEFNKYVRKQLQTLTARGETTQDLLNHLFKGYKFAKPKKFREWLDYKKRAYTDGEDMTPTALMLAAENQFASLKLEGEWEMSTKEEQLITALQATVDKHVSTITALAGLQHSKKTESKGSYKSAKLSPKERFTGKDAWKAVAPKNSEPKTKMVGNKQFHYCPKHQFWTVHTPDECNLEVAPKNDSESKPTKKAPLTFAQAAAAICNQQGDDEGSQD